jgi:hypothetical protein
MDNRFGALTWVPRNLMAPDEMKNLGFKDGEVGKEGHAAANEGNK